jgi:two-component sensor histidine kinase
LRRKDGTILTALLSSREILLGGAPRRISVVHDISDRKRGEERIHALLREKDLILKEVHHRIKNNLAVITGLLEVQASALGEGPAASALSDAKRRILSMSILYDRLYRLDGTGMASLADYLSAVVDRALDGFPRAGDLEVSREIEAVELDERSLSSLGIIVNELLTNSLKYAFSGRAGGRLRVFARREGGLLAFGVEDDGPGIPAAVREGGGEGFGLELVRVLAGQLGASLSFGAGGGSRVRLELPLEEAPAS